VGPGCSLDHPRVALPLADGAVVGYIEALNRQRQPNDIITVVVPQFVPKGAAANLLHTQAATWLQLALRGQPGIVITDVPYQVQ